MHLKIPRRSCPSWHFEQENAVDATGGALAHLVQQAHLWDHFRGDSDALRVQGKGISASFRNLQPKMDPLVHTWDQGTVETRNSTGRSWTKEIEQCPIVRECDDHRLLWFIVSDLHWVPGGGQNGHTAVPCRVIGQTRLQFVVKRPHLAKKDVLFCDDNAWAYSLALASVKLVELGYFLLFYPPYSPDLVLVFFRFQIWKKPSSARHLRQTRKSWPLRRHTLQTSRKHFFRPVKTVETSLGQVYRTKQNLCSKKSLL